MSGVSNVLGSQSPSAMKSSSGSGSSGGGMSINDFYKLLATQLKYQDADNPMDTSEMMNQMVQTQMIEAITQMSSMNMTTYASSMVGKEVMMAEFDSEGRYTEKNITGTITGVVLGTNPILYIGDKMYTLSQLMSIGKVPEKVEDKPEDKPVDKPEDKPDVGGGDGDQ